MKKSLAIFAMLAVATVSFSIVGFADSKTAKIKNITVSTEGTGTPDLTFDNDTFSSYAMLGSENIWFLWELEKTEKIESVSIAFLSGDQRSSIFDIEVSTDGKKYEKILKEVYSSGTTSDYETFEFDSPVDAKFIKYIGYGNTVSDWNNIAEFAANIYSPDVSADASGGVLTGMPGGGYVEKTEYIVSNSLMLQVGNQNALNFGTKVNVPDTMPQIIDGRTYVPVRFIAEAFGAEVLWDEDTQTVACLTADDVIKFEVGKSSFEINGIITATDSPAGIVDGRTMVPLRIIAESFGKRVLWEESKKLIFISAMEIPEPCVCEIQTLNDMLK